MAGTDTHTHTHTHTHFSLKRWTPKIAWENGLIDDPLYEKLVHKCGLAENIPGSRPISTTAECTLAYRQVCVCVCVGSNLVFCMSSQPL